MNRRFSESDIRPSTLKNDQTKAIEKDIKWLIEREDNFCKVNCPACNSDNFVPEFTRKGFVYVKCCLCNTVYNNPRPTPEILDEFYSNSNVYKFWKENVYEATSENRKKFLFKPRAELLVKKCKDAKLHRGDLLEIGSSQGFFLEEVDKLNFFRNVVGIEPTPDQAEVSRNKGIQTFEISYNKFKSESKFASIVSFETIEHLYSPFDFLLWSFNFLAPGGFIMISCPNYSGLERLVLGEESGCIDHEHLNYFSPSSFRILANRCGFIDIDITTPGFLDIEIISNALKEKRINNNQIGSFLEKLIKVEDKNMQQDFQRFLQDYNFSSSMLVIARKP